MFSFFHPRKVTSDREVPEFNVQAKIRRATFDQFVVQAEPSLVCPATPDAPGAACETAPEVSDDSAGASS